MGRRTFVTILLVSATCFSCGTLKKRTSIDTVTGNARVERISSSVSDEKTEVDDKSVETERVYEKGSNVSITERDIYFDEDGRVTRISEVVKDVSNRESESDRRKEFDVTYSAEGSSSVSESEMSESSYESVIKNTDIDRESSPIQKYVGFGAMFILVAIGIILFLKLR